jgi:hypothetical protein
MLFPISQLAPFLEEVVYSQQQSDSTSVYPSPQGVRAVQILHRFAHLPSRAAVGRALEEQIREHKMTPATALHAIAPNLPMLPGLDNLSPKTSAER